MKKVLFINGCVRLESRTRILADCVLKKLGGAVEEVCLRTESLQPLTEDDLTQREEYVKKGDYSLPSLRYAKQFASADIIVVAAPYWDLSFPSSVKTYFETVSAVGIAFRYTGNGVVESLCHAKQLIYVTTSGGEIGDRNMGYDYVKALAEVYYGIEDVVCVQAENLDIIGADVDGIMEKAKAEIERKL